MPLPPVDPNHRKNVRDDGYCDFAELKAKGEVRDKQGRIIGIDDAHTTFSARQRDVLYQGYCEYVKQGKDDEQLRHWIKVAAETAGMSGARARRIIEQGNGGWNSENSKWWRGVSV
ncbi:MAG: hypothetical protein U0570_12025 [Phycisphaerales bacterium]